MEPTPDAPGGRFTEGGFALIGALFVIIGIAGVSLIALMSMTLTASSASRSENEIAKDVRAADNALESAVNMLRMDPDGELGLNDNCIDASGVDFASNDRTVTVTGNCEESTLSMPINDSPSAEAPSVRLVGDTGYGSGSSWPDTVHWTNPCLGGNASLGSCAPWKNLIGLPNYTNYASSVFGSAHPNLVHTADMDPANPDTNKTLSFAADVRARRGSATAIPTAFNKPAVEVAGNYQQGDAGLFSTQTGVSCGVAQQGNPWVARGAQIHDSDTASLGVPTCGSAATDALALDPRYEIENDSGVALRPVFGESFTAFAATPSCSAGAGGVVQLDPGAYGKAQTAALNDLLGGNCPNRTFWFRSASATTPGAYWFDVDDTTKPDGSAQAAELRHSLIISDPTVRVIFGVPTGGFSVSSAQSAAFPQACDAEATGVEIELSPRTTMRHLAGKVAICDRSTAGSTSNVPAAIWQAGDADGGWRGVANPSASSISISQVSEDLIPWDPLGWLNDTSSLTNPTNAWVVDGSEARAEFSCQIIFSGACTGDVNMAARGFTMAGSVPAGRLDHLDVILRARAQTNGGFNLSLLQYGAAGTEVKFYAAGASTPTCGTYFPFLPDSKHSNLAMNMSVDLMAPTGQAVGALPKCDTVGLNKSDLEGAGVDVRFRLVRDVDFGIYSYITNTLWIDGIELQAGWELTPNAATAGSGWNNPANLINPNPFGSPTDTLHSGYTMQCSFWIWDGCPTDTRSVTISGFDNLVNPAVPTDGSLVDAGVIVTGETTDQNFFTNGSFYDLSGEPDISQGSWMRVTLSNLRDSPGATCSAQWPRVPFWGQGVYIDLLDSAISNCPGVLTNAGQLVGALAVLEVHVARNDFGIQAEFGTRIDSVRLSTVTSGRYTKPAAPSVMTMGAGAGKDSSFNVFGQVSTPRSDLNVRWNGPSPKDAAGEAVAIGGGNMILRSLGSYVPAGGEAGVLCCSPTRPAERIVELTARIGSQVVGRAKVVINDVGGSGSGLRIDSWRIGRDV